MAAPMSQGIRALSEAQTALILLLADYILEAA
jgi:hypothetical protein